MSKPKSRFQQTARHKDYLHKRLRFILFAHTFTSPRSLLLLRPHQPLPSFPWFLAPISLERRFRQLDALHVLAVPSPIRITVEGYARHYSGTGGRHWESVVEWFVCVDFFEGPRYWQWLTLWGPLYIYARRVERQSLMS
jgi:hypothetical protein